MCAYIVLTTDTDYLKHLILSIANFVMYYIRAMYGGLASDGKIWSNVLITNILCLAPYDICSWHIYNVFLSHLKCAIRTFMLLWRGPENDGA